MKKVILAVALSLMSLSAIAASETEVEMVIHVLDLAQINSIKQIKDVNCACSVFDVDGVDSLGRAVRQRVTVQPSTDGYFDISAKPIDEK